MAIFPVYARRITITAGENDSIVVNTAGDGDQTAVLAAGDYYLYSGDGVADDILDAIHDAIEAVITPTLITTYEADIDAGDTTGAVTFAFSSPATLKFGDAGTTFDATLIGFPASNTAAQSTHGNPLSPSATWVSDQPVVRDWPSSPEQMGEQHETANGKVYTFVRGAITGRREDSLELVTGDRTWEKISSADVARTFERFWRNVLSQGIEFRLYHVEDTDLADIDAGDLIDTFVATSDVINRMPDVERQDSADLYSWTLPMREHVA